MEKITTKTAFKHIWAAFLKTAHLGEQSLLIIHLLLLGKKIKWYI